MVTGATPPPFDDAVNLLNANVDGSPSDLPVRLAIGFATSEAASCADSLETCAGKASCARGAEISGDSVFATEAVVIDFAVVSVLAGFLLLPDDLCELRVDSGSTIEDDG